MIYKERELREIPDFTGYFADSFGNIYSVIPQGCRDRFDKTKWIEPKILNYRTTKKGYNRVYIRRDSTNKREDVYIHRIIASLFIPNPELKEEVNHKDCNKFNNSIENLEWVSGKENKEYAHKFGNAGRDELGRFCFVFRELKQNI